MLPNAGPVALAKGDRVDLIVVVEVDTVGRRAIVGVRFTLGLYPLVEQVRSCRDPSIGT